MSNLPISLTGFDLTENIVGLEALTPTTGVLYIRMFKPGEYESNEERLRNSFIIEEEINWNSWFLVHNKTFAEMLLNYKNEYGQKVFKVETMKGKLHFKYYVSVVSEYKNFWDINRDIITCFNKVFGTEYESFSQINSTHKDEIYKIGIVEQLMINTGMTLYKGMVADDVKVVVLDLETTGLDQDKDKIFLVSVYSNYGFKKLIYNESDDEEQILNELNETLQSQDYDVILTYNGALFDNQFLRTKADLYNIKLRFGRKHKDRYPANLNYSFQTTLKVGEGKEFFTPVFAHGVNYIDGIHLSKRWNANKRELKSVGLKEVAKYFELYEDSKENRVYLEGDKIYKTWLKNRDKVLTYAYQDTWETLEIYKLLIASTFVSAQIIPMSFQKVSHCGPAKIWELLMLREYLRPVFDRQRGKYYRHSIPLPYETIDFRGGFTRCYYVGIIEDVHKVDIGCVDAQTEILTRRGWVYAKDILEKDVILTLDKNNMTICYQKMDKYNVYDYKGKMYRFYNDVLDQLVSPTHRCLVKGKTRPVFKTAEKITNEEFLLEDLTWSGEVKKELIDYEGKIYCPSVKNGTFLMRKNNKVSWTGNSLYPSIMLKDKVASPKDELNISLEMLRNITELRLSYKQKVKELKEQGLKDTKEYKYSDALQLALKILINALYGSISSAYFSFNYPEGGKHVTTEGQRIIKKVRDLLIKKDCLPIELDTDGIIFHPLKKGLNIQKINDDISAQIPEGINLEYEDSWVKMLSYKRKQYALLQHDGKIKIKGGSLKSSSKAAYILNNFNKFLKDVFLGNYYEANKRYRGVLNKIANRTMDVAELCTAIKYSKSIETYEEEIKLVKEIEGKNKARQGFMELLKQQKEKTGRINYFMGDKIFFYKTGTKSTESYLPRVKEQVYTECTCTTGCEKCVDGKIYEYVPCEKCKGKGYVIKQKQCVRKNIKNTAKIPKMHYLYMLYMLWITSPDKIVSEDFDIFDEIKLEEYEVIKKLFSLEKFISINKIVLMDTENKELEINSPLMQTFLEGEELDFLKLNVKIVGLTQADCRTCVKKIKGTQELLPTARRGYVIKTIEKMTINCRLLEDAPETPDYNVAFYMDNFRKTLKNPFTNAFSEKDLEIIFSETELPKEKFEGIKPIMKEFDPFEEQEELVLEK